MIYKLLRFIFRITNRCYFKTIQVKGLENIPKTGPVFFVANHPSAFMDPIVIATVVNRPLFFLAKGSLFQNKFTRWLLPKFNMIPIFRSSENPDQMHKNKEIFSHCHKHLAKDGAILAFPEGVSFTERKIKKIQTGTSRICLGAEAENNFSLGIQIVTIGLNFSDPHSFQSDLFVNIDKPISVADYRTAYEEDPFKAAHTLTDEIRKRLESQVVAIQDAEVDKLVATIELIYKSQLLKDLGYAPGEMEDDFTVTKAIAQSVNYFMDTDPSRVEKTKYKIEAYLDELERLSLTDSLMKNIGKRTPLLTSIASLLYLIFGLPVFAFGFLNNYFPFKIPGWMARRISERPEFFGSLAISLGTFTFLIFYSLQIWLLHTFTNDWRIISAYVLLLPLSGFFAYSYYKRFTTLRGNWRIFSLFYKKTKLITSLLLKREMILAEFEQGKNDFENHTNEDVKLKELKLTVTAEDHNHFFNLES
ncbi:hypothetical protein CNR22_01365 [Sphingobacteriaceae bacterium]|nr:hypothetical protein CNR22_01365 [Sphingobacteriaceae bacterium]